MEITFSSCIICIHVQNSFFNKCFFLKWHNISKIYIKWSLWESWTLLNLCRRISCVKPFNWKKYLFCIFSTFTLSISLPHKIIPYLIKEKFCKYIFLNINKLKSPLSDVTFFNFQHKNWMWVFHFRLFEIVIPKNFTSDV